MALTYTQAVELLESYGIKVSASCNGMETIKGCALVIQRLERARKITNLKDGDILVIQEDTNEIEMRRFYELLKNHTGGKKIVLVFGTMKIKNHTADQKIRFLKTIVKSMSPAEIAEVFP